MEEIFGNNIWLAIAAGAVVGALVILFFTLIITLIVSRSRKSVEKQQELVGKAVAQMMSKVYELFVAYRIGEIEFKDLEREAREFISKITEEINEHHNLLNAAYVSIANRYVDDKNASLIAMREELNHIQQNAQVAPQAQPIAQPAAPQSIAPEVAFAAAAVTSVAQDIIPAEPKDTPVPEVAPVVAPAPVQEVVQEQALSIEPTVEEVLDEPVIEDAFALSEELNVQAEPAPVAAEPVPQFDAFEIEESVSTAPEAVNTAPIEIETQSKVPAEVENPFADLQADLGADFASSIVDEVPVVEPVAPPTPAPTPEPEPVVLETPAPKPAAPAAPASSDLAFDINEFDSAIDSAFDLDGLGDAHVAPAQPAAAAPVQPTAQVAPAAPSPAPSDSFALHAEAPKVESNPFQGFEAPKASVPKQQAPTNQPGQRDPFNLGAGSLDVEATQEFNLNDIMSQAQQYDEPESTDDSMVSGDDVGNALDNLFG